MKARVIFVVVTLAIAFALTGAADSAYAAWHRDKVGPINEGTYTITPGYWTRDGVIVATTFPTGGVIPPPNQVHQDVWIEPPANDFHYDCDTWRHANGTVTHHAADVWFWGPITLGTYYAIPIIINDGSADSVDIDLEIDWSVDKEDPPVILVKDDVEIYNGPMSGLAAVLPDYDLKIGSYRRVGSSQCLPTMTEWGIVALLLLLVLSGVYVIYRRRRATARA